MKNVKKQNPNRLDYNAKAKMELKKKTLPRFGDNKTVIEYDNMVLKNKKKQDLDRMDHNAEANTNKFNTKENKLIKYNNKVMRNVKKQDLNRINTNTKAKICEFDCFKDKTEARWTRMGYSSWMSSHCEQHDHAGLVQRQMAGHFH